MNIENFLYLKFSSSDTMLKHSCSGSGIRLNCLEGTPTHELSHIRLCLF